MLYRTVADNGVTYYRSPVLAAVGIPHAFSTRVGGVSRPPFDSLNLGNPNGCAVQDDVAQIAENYRLLQEACGLAGRHWCRVHQVHGAGVVFLNSVETSSPDEKADALVTTDPAAAISIRIADCVPILIGTVDGKIVAAIHAGWRGVIAGAIAAAVDVIRQNSDAKLLAAIGPCISGDAFEVGHEVAAEFQKAFGAKAPIIRPPGSAKPHVDLRQAVQLQLLELGLHPEHIDTTDRCTVRDVEEFYSHRRDNGVTGRMAAMIGVKA